MKINFYNGVGRKALALILVGTMATGITVGKVMLENNFTSQAYYDEDVKREKEKLDRLIREGGSSKTKSFGKRDVAPPKKINKV